VYKSTDGGITWQTHTLDIRSSIRDFVIDPEETNNIFIALGEVLK
jgi:hypothetical protein